MANPTTSIDPTMWSLVITKLLDWPVLLFALVLIIMWRGGGAIADVLKGRKLYVELGGNKLSVGDAVQALDYETKQALDDFRKHQQEINAIKLRLAALEQPKLAYGACGPTRSSATSLAVAVATVTLPVRVATRSLGEGRVMILLKEEVVTTHLSFGPAPTEWIHP
jgi:hypothetical protein